MEFGSFAVFHLEMSTGMFLYAFKILYSKWKFLNIKNIVNFLQIKIVSANRCWYYIALYSKQSILVHKQYGDIYFIHHRIVQLYYMLNIIEM